MSLYQQCMEAVEEFIHQPPKGFGGIFTEIDVVQRIQKPSWTTARLKEARRQANQVCGHRYLRTRELCRYGPVVLPDGQADYGRVAGKIAYGSIANGPEEWVTPNGTFTQLLAKDDSIAKAGCKPKNGRDDLTLWDEQDIVVPLRVVRAQGDTPLHQQLQEANGRIRELEDELRRLRARKSDQLVKLTDEVNDLRRRRVRSA